MRYVLGFTGVCVLVLAAHIDQPIAQTDSSSTAQLSEQDRAVVMQAALDAKSHQKTPKDFTPSIGARVPNSVYLHGFKPDIAGKVPSLKRLWYAYLDGEIALVDGMQSKVVAVIPFPESGSVGQGHHGAAEAAGESKSRDGASATESVPAYTSPETIK
jgi:hypothetical protein